jgi:hypothetical protein
MSKPAGTVDTTPWQRLPLAWAVAGPKSSQDELRTGHQHSTSAPVADSLSHGAVMHAAHGLGGHAAGLCPRVASHQPVQLKVDTRPGAANCPSKTAPAAIAKHTGAAFVAQGALVVHCLAVAA